MNQLRTSNFCLIKFVIKNKWLYAISSLKGMDLKIFKFMYCLYVIQDSKLIFKSRNYFVTMIDIAYIQ